MRMLLERSLTPDSPVWLSYLHPVVKRLLYSRTAYLHTTSRTRMSRSLYRQTRLLRRRSIVHHPKSDMSAEWSRRGRNRLGSRRHTLREVAVGAAMFRDSLAGWKREIGGRYCHDLVVFLDQIWLVFP